MRRLLLVSAFLLMAWAVSSLAAPHAQGCAFSRTPTTYEAMRDRAAFLTGLDLAAYNMLFPDDTFFGTPRVESGTRSDRRVADEPYVPPTLLKAIGWIESGLAQAARSVPWGAVGPTLISFDCGHGIMQITSGMTSPADDGWPSTQQSLIATHYLYDIGRGAAILLAKWNGAPEVRPIAGTDTDSDPTIVENWYFAVWSYNGFTGPGANRSNHPMDPIYEWPRTGFSCGPADDGYGHTYAYPYQELVFGCAARPPSVDGQQLWTPLPLSLPDLDDPEWSDPLSLSNFTSSDWYRRMDMPTPRPWHRDQTPRPAAGVAAFLLSSPSLNVSHAEVTGQANELTIFNSGSGLLAWRAKPEQRWISVDKQAGVALAPSVPCTDGAPCERSPTLTITVNPALAPPTEEDGWVTIESLTTGRLWRVRIVRGDWPNRIGVPGTISR